MLQHLLKDQEIENCRKRADEDTDTLGEDQLVRSTVGGKSSLKVRGAYQAGVRGGGLQSRVKKKRIYQG